MVNRYLLFGLKIQRQWSVKLEKIVKDFSEQKEDITCMAITKDSDYLIACTGQGAIMQIGIKEKKIIQVLNDKLAVGPQGTVIGDLKCVKISDDGCFVYTGGVDGVQKQWEFCGKDRRLEFREDFGNVVNENENMRDSMDFVLQ